MDAGGRTRAAAAAARKAAAAAAASSNGGGEDRERDNIGNEGVGSEGGPRARNDGGGNGSVEKRPRRSVRGLVEKEGLTDEDGAVVVEEKVKPKMKKHGKATEAVKIQDAAEGGKVQGDVKDRKKEDLPPVMEKNTVIPTPSLRPIDSDVVMSSSLPAPNVNVNHGYKTPVKRGDVGAKTEDLAADSMVISSGDRSPREKAEREMTLHELRELGMKLRWALREIIPDPTPAPLPKAPVVRHWANLLAQNSKQTNIPLKTQAVLIGRGTRCGVQIHDLLLPTYAGRFVLAGGRKPMLESHSSSIAISVNGKKLAKNQAVILKSGDEISMSSGHQSYSYIFQFLRYWTVAPSERSSPVRNTTSPKERQAQTPFPVWPSNACVQPNSGSADNVQVQARDDILAGARKRAHEAIKSLRRMSNANVQPSHDPADNIQSHMRDDIFADAGKQALGAVKNLKKRSNASVPPSHDPTDNVQIQVHDDSLTNAQKQAISAYLREAVRNIRKMSAQDRQEGMSAAARVTNVSERERSSRKAGHVNQPVLKSGGRDQGKERAREASEDEGAANEGAVAETSPKGKSSRKDEASVEGGLLPKGAIPPSGEESAKGDERKNTSPKPSEEIKSLLKGDIETARDDVESLLKAKEKAESIFSSDLASHDKIDTTFNKFPYSFISKELRTTLELWAYVHLLHPEYAHVAAKIPALSQRILLHGPAGTRKYQEEIVYALGKELGANVLSLDIDAETFNVDDSSKKDEPSKSDEKLSGEKDSSSESPSTVTSTMDMLSQATRRRILTKLAARYVGTKLPATPKDTGKKTSFALGDRVIFLGSPEWLREKIQEMRSKAGLNARKSFWKDDEFGKLSAIRRRGRSPPTLNAMDLFPSKRGSFEYTPQPFYASGMPEEDIPEAVHMLSSAGLSADAKKGSLGAAAVKGWTGPMIGARGKVVLTFSSDAKRVGVRFDRPIMGGNNLGDRCDPSRGFFVKTREICHEREELKYVNLTPNVLAPLMKKINAAVEEGKPIIILVKDVERKLTRLRDRSPEIYRQVMSALTKIPKRVVAIGTSTCSSALGKSYHHAVSGLMSLSDLGHSSRRLGSPSPFSSLGGLGSVFYSASPNTIDLSVLDHISRSESDKSTCIPALSKSTLRLFPVQIPIPLPEDSHGQAEKFKQEVERDIKTDRVTQNQERFTRVMSKIGVDVVLENVIELQTEIFDDAEIAKIAGYALASELKYRDETSRAEKATQEGDVDMKGKENSRKPASDAGVEKAPEYGKAETTCRGDEPEQSAPEIGTPMKREEQEKAPSKETEHWKETAPVEEIQPAKTVELLKDGTSQSGLAFVEEADKMEIELGSREKSPTSSDLLGKKRSLEQMEVEDAAKDGVVKKKKKKIATVRKIKLSSASISKAIQIVLSQRHKKENDGESKDKNPLANVQCGNDFERKLLSEVVPAGEIGVRFDDIGALDGCKEALQEIVMLPLKRPELFRRGNLTKPTKGVLLFGPPGTGKTMLAKAVATEAGANFINITMSSIASKWFGEGEKYVKALFSLARKIAPSVIFIDEVDSMLGKRERPGEHEAMRKIKNEFMSNWDGLRSKDSERVLVLGATNRPFDLDDAVLRRMPRRLLVDLPDAKNRAKILSVITSGEEMDESVDLTALAESLDGYSGSDLRNLCVAAAHAPIREILAAEKKEKEERSSDSGAKPGEESKEPKVRPLRQADFLAAKNEVSASVSEDAFSISELRKWNETYGEGGSRRKSPLPYFM